MCGVVRLVCGLVRLVCRSVRYPFFSLPQVVPWSSSLPEEVLNQILCRKL